MTLLLAASVIPPLFLLWKVYQMDQIEKEPPKLLLTIFILGMISTIPAGLLEMVGQAILVSILPEGFLATSFGTTVANLLMYLIVVGGVRCRKIDFFDTLPELRKQCPTMRIIYFFGRLTDETEQSYIDVCAKMFPCGYYEVVPYDMYERGFRSKLAEICMSVVFGAN